MLVAIWVKTFRHIRSGTLLFALFPPSFFPLISLANGNFLGRPAVEGIVVVTKRNGENPVSGRVFLLPSSSSWIGGREMKEKEWVETVIPASLLVLRFSQDRTCLQFAV